MSDTAGTTTLLDTIRPILERDFKLRAAGSGKWRGSSLNDPKSDNKALLLTEGKGTGGAVWFDFGQDLGGNMVDLAHELNKIGPYAIPVPKWIDATAPLHYDTKRAFASLVEYATFQGAMESSFIGFGWQRELVLKFCPVAKRKRPALAFRTASKTRYRFVDGDKPKYINEEGHVRCWYALKGALALLDGDLPLVFCNGETSSVVAQHYLVPAATVAGGAEKSVPGDLLDVLDTHRSTWNGRILIALDTDSAGRKAAGKTLDSFLERGYDAWAVNLGGGIGFDLANFCKLHAGDSLSALLAAPDLYAPRYFTSTAIRSSAPDTSGLKEKVKDLEAKVESQALVLQRTLLFMKNKKLPQGMRLTAIATLLEVQHRKAVLGIPDGGHVPIRIQKIAEEAGSNRKTVGKHLQEFARGGYIDTTDRKVPGPRDSATGKPTVLTEVSVRLNPAMFTPEVIEKPGGNHWGGTPKTCASCGSEELVIRTTSEIVCKGCGDVHVMKITHKTVNPGDETLLDDVIDEQEDAHLFTHPVMRQVDPSQSGKIIEFQGYVPPLPARNLSGD